MCKPIDWNDTQRLDVIGFGGGTSAEKNKSHVKCFRDLGDCSADSAGNRTDENCAAAWECTNAASQHPICCHIVERKGDNFNGVIVFLKDNDFAGRNEYMGSVTAEKTQGRNEGANA